MRQAPAVVVTGGDARRAPGAAPGVEPGVGAPSRKETGRTIAGGVLLRAVFLVLLVLVSSAVFARAGAAVLAPGPWLGADVAVFQALNGVDLPGLTALLYATLNDPGRDYLALIVVLLAYCAWRRMALVPAAALAIGVALALNNVLTQDVHHAGTRPRPFTQIAGARTPVGACGGLGLLAMRGADGAVAPCGAPAPGEAPPAGALRGVDWREIWTPYPSYPSGHMREAVALAVLLVAFWRRSWPYVLGLMVVLGLSRVHLGAHYPTDVIGGSAMGLASGLLAVLVLDLLRRVAVAVQGVPAAGRARRWVARLRETGRPQPGP